MRKTVGVLLSSLLVSSTIWTGTALGAAVPINEGARAHHSVFADLGNHWSKQAVEKWQGRGIIQGASEGKFAPERTLTRAEWVALLNRTFQLTRQTAEVPTDVQEGSWYASDLKAALTAGYIGLTEDGSFQANRALTREEAAVSLSTLLRLSMIQPDTDAFSDFKTSTEANGAPVYAAVEAGLLKGYTDGTFRPNQSLTRAEAAVLIDRAAEAYGLWVGEQGEYGSADAENVEQQKGSVIVNTPGVTLQNLDIAGDLVIGKNVGEGDVTLKNVTVHGNTYVYGGGENSIHIEGSHLVNIIVDKKEGTVRIVAQGETTVQEVVVRTGANLEAEKGVTVNKVELTNELPANSEVRLAGYFNTVNVQAYSVALDIPSGSIGELNIGKEAEGATLNTGSESHILTLLLNAAAKVVGIGKIDSATINAKDITFDKSPTAVKVGKDVPADTKVSVGGQQVSAGAAAPTAQPATSVSSSVPTSNETGMAAPGDGTQTTTPIPNPIPDPWNQKMEINVKDRVVGLGDAIYFSSSVNGTAYLSSRDIAYYDLPTLELGVQSGEVLKTQVIAGQKSSIETTGLRNVSYPDHYQFNVTVYQETTQRYLSKEIEILNENEALIENPITFHYHSGTGYDTGSGYETDSEFFSFNYNRILKLAPEKKLSEIVQLKLEGEDGYKPFDSSQGSVEVVGGRVYVKPIAEQLGRNFSLKLLADSVVTTDGQSNQEFLYGPANSFIKIKLLSHGGAKSAIVKKGEDIQFSVEYATSVYLNPSNLSGSKEEFDKKVEEGWGEKLDVSEEQTNQPLTISTEGLEKGRYLLQAWSGYYIFIEIVD